MSSFWPYMNTNLAQLSGQFNNLSHEQTVPQVASPPEADYKHGNLQAMPAEPRPPDLASSIDSFRDTMLDKASRNLGTHMFALLRATMAGAHTPIGTPDLYTNLGHAVGNASILTNSASRRQLLPYLEPHWYTAAALFPFAGLLPHPEPRDLALHTDSRRATELYIRLAREQIRAQYDMIDKKVRLALRMPPPNLPSDLLSLVRTHAMFVAGPPFGTSFAESWVLWDGPGCMQTSMAMISLQELHLKVNGDGRTLGTLYDVVAGLCLGGNRHLWDESAQGVEHRVWALCCRKGIRAVENQFDFRWRYFLIVRGRQPLVVSWASLEALLRALPYLNQPAALREELQALPEWMKAECEIVENEVVRS